MLILAAVSLGLLLYTWLLYPVFVRLLGHGRDASGAGHGPAASVSVILATRESDAAITRRIDNLRDTAHSGVLEVIVACDARREGGTATSVARSGVRVVAGDPPGGKATALNAGVQAATGDILVFTDTGQAFDRETIPRLVAALAADGRLGAVSGALQIAGGGLAAWYWRYERWLRHHEARLHSTIGVTGAVYAMPRALWNPLRAGLILDDLFTPMRLIVSGYRVGFEPRAIARDDREFAPSSEYRRKARTLTGVLQLCAWLPAVLSPRKNPAWLQFTSHKLLRLLTPWLLIGVLVGVIGVAGSRAPDDTKRLITAGSMLLVILLLLSRGLRDVVWGALLMQAAVVRATWNALRGDWDVWRN